MCVRVCEREPERMPRIRCLVAGALAVAVAAGIPPRGAIAAPLSFASSQLALGAPVTSLSDVRLDGEYIAAAGGARITLVAFDDAGRPLPAGEIALPSGTDAAGVVSIGEPDESESSVPWTGDLLVSDRAGARLLHLHREAGVWQVLGSLPTGTAPGLPIWVAEGASPVLGVLDTESASLSLLAPDAGTWRPAGARSVGARPVDAALFGLPDSGDDALAVVNAGAGTLSILSGKGYGRRRDILVGREPVAVDVWDQDDDVMIAVANSGSRW